MLNANLFSAKLTKAYQTATVLFDVLKAVSSTQSLDAEVMLLSSLVFVCFFLTVKLVLLFRFPRYTVRLKRKKYCMFHTIFYLLIQTVLIKLSCSILRFSSIHSLMIGNFLVTSSFLLDSSRCFCTS